MEKYKEAVAKLNEKQSLRTLQKIRKDMWLAGGFDDETVEQTMLLLVEEVGELAKAIRKNVAGMKCDVAKDNFSTVGEEAADVFNLLLDLCTIMKIDLFDVFKDKNIKCSTRIWKSNKN